MPISITSPLTCHSNVAVENVNFLAQGESDAVFPDWQPDDWKAYVAFDMAKCFPNIIGPESSGHYFGFHPRVLANSFESLLHQQINLNHALKAYGAPKDRIVGCVVGVAFPDEPDGGWQIGAMEDAPSLHVLAVLFKLSDGMSRMMGEHTTNRKKWSVSMEVLCEGNAVGVYRRSSNELYPLHGVPEAWFDEAIYTDENGILQVGTFENEQLAMALGGEDGKASFQGTALTPTPAEQTASITSLRAEDGRLVRMAASAPEMPWHAGQMVAWEKLERRDAGCGKVLEVHVEGEHQLAVGRVRASFAEPVLRIKPSHRNYEVLRRARSVHAA